MSEIHYNRKQRRDIARQLGMLGKASVMTKDAEGREVAVQRDETFADRADRTERSIHAGRSIESQFMQGVENAQRETAARREAEALTALTERIGAERAVLILEGNERVARAREEKLRRKKERRGA